MSSSSSDEHTDEMKVENNTVTLTRCACGCGQFAKQGNKFVKSHQLKMITERKPRGPNKIKKPRKYKKRNKKFWEAKQNNHSITSYIMPELRKELDEMHKKIDEMYKMVEAVVTQYHRHNETFTKIIKMVNAQEQNINKLGHDITKIQDQKTDINNYGITYVDEAEKEVAKVCPCSFCVEARRL